MNILCQIIGFSEKMRPTSFHAGERVNDTVEVSRDVFEPIAMLVREGLFENEKDALKCLVLDQAA